jgi:ligand-binding SRPBCC domain-containing protein
VKLKLQTEIAAPVERCFDLSRSIELHLLGTEQTKERAVDGTTSGLIGMGEFVRWQAVHFGVKQHLASRITAFDPPRYFQDTMIEGAFRSMRHDHFSEAQGPGKTLMTDDFIFEAPLGVLGLIAETLVLKGYMDRLLTHRNAVLKQAAESDAWIGLLGAMHGEGRALKGK